MSHTSLSLIITLATLFVGWVHSLDTCSNSASTLYDGYLDTFVYYGNFQQAQNSYFKFTNPYLGQTAVTSATVSFWAKIPSVSSNGVSNTGRFLDCQDIISLRLVNDTVQYQVAIGR